jgi:cytochrome c551
LVYIFKKIGAEHKMKQITLLLIAAASAGLVGCSKTDNYTPAESASGEDIFYANCTKCHKPESAGSVMTLNTATANKDAIIEKIQKGSMGMPAFPNIKGEPAQRLAEFILANSKTK